MLEVIICGAGPVGCYLALLLSKHHNCRVRVYERRADLRTGKADVGRSINLILTSRGMHALTQVGLQQAALALCVPVEERAVHLVDGSVSHQPYGISPTEVNYSVSRTAINALLIQAAEDAGAKFFFEHAVERVDLWPESASTHLAGRLLATNMKTNTTFNVTDANLIVGGDGAGSAVRTGVYNALVFAGVRSAPLYIERLGVSYKEVQFHSTPDGKYPLRPQGLHIWPRGSGFLMALADKEPSLTGTLYVPDGTAAVPGSKKGAPLPEDLASKFDRDPVAFERYVREQYPDLPALVPDFMKQLQRAPFTFLATLRSSNWHYSARGICLGDAAHAVVPFFGQGMNLGLETAWTFNLFVGDSLRRWSSDVRSVPLRLHAGRCVDAFAAFHQPNAKALADMAIYNYGEMANFVSQAWYQRRKAIETAIEKAFPAKMRSRYFMVTGTLIPYALVEQAGTHVANCVDAVGKYMEENKMENPNDVPRGVMEKAIDTHVAPFFQRYGIRVDQPKKEYYAKNAKQRVPPAPLVSQQAKL